MTTGYTREQLNAMEELFEKSLPPLPTEADKERLPVADACSAAGSPFGIWVRFHLEADQYVLVFLNPVTTLLLFQGINDCAMDAGWWKEQVKHTGSGMPEPTAESSNQANEVVSLTTASSGDVAIVNFARRDGSTQMIGLHKQTAIDLFLIFKHAGEQFGLWDEDFELLPAESSVRIQEMEILRAANQLMQQNPETAQSVATNRSHAAYAVGDMFNFQMWARVAQAVVKPIQTKPDGPNAIN
jgi:hypothetical protein